MKKSMKIIVLALAIATLVGCCFAFAACDKDDRVKVGVQSGTTGQYYVEGDESWGFGGFSNLECVGYTNGALAVQDMLNGGVQYVVIDEAPARKIVAGMSGTKVIDIRLTDEEYAFGVNKDDPALMASVNEYIELIKSNGTFESILNNYFGDGTPQPVTSAVKDANKNQLVVATNAAFAPFEYKMGNQFAGVDMEIAAGLAQYLNMELVIEDMDFESVVTSVGKNGVDMAMAGLTINEKRKESVDFTNTYYQAFQVIIAKSDDTKFDGCVTAADVEAVLKSL